MTRNANASPFDGAITVGALFLTGGAVVRTVILGSPIAPIDFKAAIQSEAFSSEHIAALASLSIPLGGLMITLGALARLVIS